MARTKKGSLPTYRHHKASGQAVVTIDSQDVYLGAFDTPASKAEYARVIAEYAATGQPPKPKRQAGSPDPISVMRVLAEYLKHAATYYVKDGRPTEEQKAVRKVIGDVKGICGHLPAEEFGPKMLKAVRQVWLDQGLCRNYINQNTGRVRRMFKWAVAEELVSPAILEGLRAVDGLRKNRSVARESKPVLPVPLDVVERTIPHLSSIVADMIRFQVLTGARPGEVCKLRPADIDRSDDVWEYAVDGHKMEHHGRERVVYIGPEAQAVLAPYLLRDPLSQCFSAAESNAELRAKRTAERKTPLSCGNRPGKKSGGLKGSNAKRAPKPFFTTGSYGQAIKRACDLAFPAPDPLCRREGESAKERDERLTAKQREELKAWIKSQRWHPNQLRHTRGTEVRKRFGLEAAQVILGHAAANVTQIYAERDADKAREVARMTG